MGGELRFCRLRVCREKARWSTGSSQGPGWDVGEVLRIGRLRLGGSRGERAKEATMGLCAQKYWGAGSRVHPQNTGLQGLYSSYWTGARWVPQPGTWI